MKRVASRIKTGEIEREREREKERDEVKMLREDALIKSNGILKTTECVLLMCVNRERHQFNDVQCISSAVDFSCGLFRPRIDH